jgi:hypothetical protein
MSTIRGLEVPAPRAIDLNGTLLVGEERFPYPAGPSREPSGATATFRFTFPPKSVKCAVYSGRPPSAGMSAYHY